MSFEIEQDERGLYGLCIFKAENKSNEEIEEIFGEYGNIVSYHRPNETLLFVRYGTYEEASSCCKGLANHSEITVKPAKRRASNFNCPDNQRRHQARRGKIWENRDHSSRPRDSGFNKNSAVQRKQDEDFSCQTPRPPLRPARKSPERDATHPAPEVAKVVMFANLHMDIQQKDIYNLCSKSQVTPLKVTMKHFKPPGYRTIYYAHVHVNTDNDVEMLTKCLNNLRLNQLKIIVSGVDKLLEDNTNQLT